MYRLVVLTLCCITAVRTQWSNVIYVDPINGNDTESCRNGEDMHDACATLAYSVGTLVNSTRIVLLDGSHRVSVKIQISNCSQIALSGMNYSNAVIMCPKGSNAGLEFIDVVDLQLTGISIENCGHLFKSTTREDTERMALFRSAVYVLNSTDVAFKSVAFMNNRGVGLSLFDVSGVILVLDSHFTGNSVPEGEKDAYNGGGGMYIEHTYCTPGLLPDCDFQSNPYSNNSMINISNCQFTNNHGSNVPNQSTTELVYQRRTNSRRLGNGGGITITLKGLSSQNSLYIGGCRFENNSAGFGGGIDTQLQDYVTDNIVQISDCEFVNNTAVNGGGGLFIGIFYYEGDTIFANQLVLNRVGFTKNRAQYGGGCEFSSSRTKSSDFCSNKISFIGCFWDGNTAMLGAALLLDPEAWSALTDGALPVPLIKDCNFTCNQITAEGIPVRAITDVAEGALYSSTYTVDLSSSVLFFYNDGTALSATAGMINILESTTVVFRENHGVQGGALALLEFASLQLFRDSHLVFDRNFASNVGGAIYAAVHDIIDFYYSRNCFIRYYDQTVDTKEWNATIKFWNNSTGVAMSGVTVRFPSHREHHDQRGTRGSSIYAETIQPCVHAADTSGSAQLQPKDAFPRQVYHFQDTCYRAESDNLCGVSTAPSYLNISPPADKYSESTGLNVSPGELFNLNLTALDELNHTIYPVVSASLNSSCTSAVLESRSQYVADGNIQINGEVGATCFLELSTMGRKKVTKVINVTLDKCSVGFVYQENSGQCVCSATTQDRHYQGIAKCSSDNSLHALLNKGFWAGCDERGQLLTAECPLGYCRSSNDSKPFYTLPGSCGDLNGYLCGPRNRRGNLCGECMGNLTVFYHSQRFSCHTCKFSHLGWLFYTLSELLPTMIVFVMVIVFNVHLTSGAWYSVVLYAQIIDFYEVNSLEFFDIPSGLAELTNIYRFFYGMFNLDFLKYEDKLSFCLWDGATVLDVLTFKYLTTAFALLLLVVLILCFRSPCWSRCENTWERSQRALHSRRGKSWVVHGISTFLIISYAQCAKVSFEVLTWTQMLGEGYTPLKKVVFLSGSVEYFGRGHLPYAIPALIVVLLIILPPLLLIVYPNVVQVVSNACDEGEDTHGCCNREVCSLFRQHFQIAKFKPVIDSFQGCFKDRYRFFAGLFFLYRFVISLSFAFSTNAVSLYISLEMIVILMLAFHSFAQPYERRFYNLVDTFMLANLAIVNGLSLFNYYWVNYSSAGGKEVITALAVQLILVYLPILYIVIMCVLFLATSYSRRARRYLHKVNAYVPLFKDDEENMELLNNAEDVPFDDDHLPHRMFEDESTDHGEEEEIRRPSRNRNYGAAGSEPNTDRVVQRPRSNKTI